MIANLTGVRAVAALWVVLFHLAETPTFSVFDLGFLIRAGSWGVDIFFVLSGLVLALVYASDGSERFRRDPVAFLIRRFAKIYPLHIFTFAIAVLLWGIAKKIGYTFSGNAQNNFESGIANIFMVHAWGVTDRLGWNAPSWSISAEWFAYLVVFPAVLMLWRFLPTVAFTAITIASWGALLAYSFAYWTGAIDFTTFGVIRIIPEFIAGILVFKLLAVRTNGDLMTALGVIGIVFCCAWPNVLTPALLPSIMLLLFGLSKGGMVSNRIFGSHAFVFIGERSYSIYMVHGFVILALTQLMRRVDAAADIHPAVVLVGTVATCVAAGCVAYIAIEVPGRQLVLDIYARIRKNR